MLCEYDPKYRQRRLITFVFLNLNQALEICISFKGDREMPEINKNKRKTIPTYM